MARVNKVDIINYVCEEAYLSFKDAKASVEATFDIITKALQNGHEVNISNFGVIKPIERKERIGTNPETHEKITLKARKSVSIKLSKKLKESL